MRKIWKKLIACAVAGALTVTSLSTGALDRIVQAAGDPTEDTVGTSITGKSTAYVETPDNPAPFRDLSSDEITEEMGIGWNLGNTMDGHSNYSSSETAWQSVKTTKSMIKAVHDLGYNTIRIPVTWGKMINEDYSVDEAWMSRVQDITDYAISQNMYVMINLHHDGAFNGENSPHGWLDIGGTEEEFASVTEKFNGLWKTIAERFKNYDEHLTFASMNEVYEVGYGWSGDADIVNKEYIRINALNQSFVDVIRATGSNNAKRWLIAPGVNTQITKMIEPDKFNFVVPTDAVNRVMVEAHDYDPWGVTSTRETREGSYAYQFKKLKELYVDNGIPVVIGEFGFVGASKTASNYEGVSYLLKKYNLIGTAWDNSGWTGTSDNYGLIDRKSEKSGNKSITDGMMRGYFFIDDVEKLGKTSITNLTGFDVSKENVSLKAGESTTITVSNKLPSNSNDVVLWKSDNAEIASVYNGKIMARAIGTTTITAFAQSGSETAVKTIDVTVEAQDVAVASTAIKTDYKSYELENGGEAFINGSAEPAGNGAYVTYQSSDSSVVTVSTMGKMVAIALGSATVTATTSDGLIKEISVTVVEPKAPVSFELKLALHAYYNDKAYYGTEVGKDVLSVNADGTYTLKFDCATDLSDNAKAAGITNLNKIGSLYIKDWEVTSGDKRRSPNIQGKIRFNSIKLNGAEMLPGDTENQNALKGGIFDSGNPLNVWDGSVVTQGITEDKTNWNITFDAENPTVIEVTFTLCGFTGPITQPNPWPETPAPATPTPEVTATPIVTTPPAVSPTVEPTATADTVKKGDVKTISGSKYKVTDTTAKTVEYQAQSTKNKTKITVPDTVKITVDGKKVSYKVTSIAKNAFKSNKKLTSVVIGKNIKKIGDNAFNGCTKLKTIKINSIVLKSVGKNALKNVNAKCKVKVPKKKLASYKKLFNKKGQKKTVKIVKA